MAREELDIFIKSISLSSVQCFAHRKKGVQLVQKNTKLSKGREPIKNIILRVKGYVEQHFVSSMQLKGKSFRQ